ncbi:interleukin-26 [Oryzias melastigma]|nr:interleukin-26 [Oryzias melastigma]
MSPIILRTLCLSLLVSFISGAVITTTARLTLNCSERVHPKLIQDLWNWTKQLKEKLPEDKSPVRLVPKFCVSCSKRVIGWMEIRELVDVYQAHVFSSKALEKLLHVHYNDVLHRLQNVLQNCVSSSEPSKFAEEIQEMGTKIKKKHHGAMKAASEFTFVLGWISELK